ERPITCTEGTNVLVGNDPRKVLEAADTILHGPPLSGRVPEKWDGKAAERIVEVLIGSGKLEYRRLNNRIDRLC
ncbi:MAG: hypothetical protein IH613_03470, partial [Desulfuromonadales bacterium]|nr:hypothetical protein [Desulfuromonadales bacterium]